MEKYFNLAPQIIAWLRINNKTENIFALLLACIITAYTYEYFSGLFKINSPTNMQFAILAVSLFVVSFFISISAINHLTALYKTLILTKECRNIIEQMKCDDIRILYKIYCHGNIHGNKVLYDDGLLHEICDFVSDTVPHPSWSEFNYIDYKGYCEELREEVTERINNMIKAEILKLKSQGGYSMLIINRKLWSLVSSRYNTSCYEKIQSKNER